ncbi:MAG: hypothetical protein KKE50_00740, partial [Nanoarchaeota archaeon]|nr:hypothetical protein [Nanoarchaeota archaeon]
PAPFVSGGAADVAIIYGNNAAFSDGLAAGEIQSSLQFELGTQTASGGSTSTGTISGEAAPLFTGGSKLYINDTLNAVKTIVTKSDMPIVLADGSFSGNVDATYTETITLGSIPRIIYGKVPTSSDDPTFALSYSTDYLYNATTTFNKAVALNHTDSKNQELTLFGKTFTIAAATDGTSIVLLKEATTLNFDSSGTTSQEVTVSGKKYTVEMVSASATTATIKVTNEAGTNEQKEVSEAASKKINGLTVAVNTADTNNLKYTASVVAGSEKVTLSDGNAVTYGDSSTQIDGTSVGYHGGTVGDLTKLTISVSASESDKDAIKAGEKFIDPVFGTFAVDFSGLNIPAESTAREEIAIRTSGDDKMTLDVTDARGNAKTGLQWAINATGACGDICLQHDSNGHNIVVSEMATINRTDMVVVGNEDEGMLIQITNIVNNSDTGVADTVTWKDVFTGESQTVSATSEGGGDITIGGKVYTFAMVPGISGLSSDARQIRLQYPDSSAVGDMIIYPTIQTSKGAKLMFYTPLIINLANWDGNGIDTTTIKIPNGDGYRSITAVPGAGNGFGTNITVNSVVLGNGTLSTAVTLTGTRLTYNFTATAANTTTVYLVDPKNNVNIVDPAIVLIEEKDDNSQYNAIITTLSAGWTSTTSLKVSDVIRTWRDDGGTAGSWESLSLPADSNKQYSADLFGTIILQDSSTAQDKFAVISYPDEQLYAQLYISASDATITPGTASGGTVANLGYPVYKDSEVSSVSTKNLIVVGGSCINTVAAKILGSDSAKCGADFTTLASVGANQALVKVVTSPYSATKVAMLIAGYEAADTTKAAKYVTTEKPATAKDTTVKLSTSSAVATVVA